MWLCHISLLWTLLCFISVCSRTASEMGLLTPTIDHAALVCVRVQLVLLSKYEHLKVKIIHDLKCK